MNRSSLRSERGHQFWIIVAVASVLLWRVAAWQWPSSFIGIPDDLRLPLALLGMLFLICGLLAWWLRPNRWTGIFLFYGIGGAIHWGGAIGSQDPRVELGFFFTYLALTALGDAALLHLALVYPSGRSIERPWKMALYAPAALAMISVPITGFVTQTVVQTLAGLLLFVANLFSIVAGVLFLVHLFRADAATRRAAHLPLIGASMILASVLALLGVGAVLPGHPEAWNLALALIPISLALALTSPALQALTKQTGPDLRE